MKRNNTQEETIPELPKDAWIYVFRIVADQRSLPWRAVSRDWDQWIVEEGLTELIFSRQDFMEKMKNLSKYKSVRSVQFSNQYLMKDLILERGLDFFSRLQCVSIIEDVIQKKDFYLKVLKYMYNLVSLYLRITNQDIPMAIMPKLINLRTLYFNAKQSRDYTWLSEVTQLDSLTIYYSKDYRITQNESLLLDRSISRLTQLKSLHLIGPRSSFSFLQNLILLERFIINTLPGIPPLLCPDLSRLVNLRHLQLPAVTTYFSLNLLKNMNHLECLYFPGIPTEKDIVILNEKLPKLKHLVLQLEYSYFLKNMRLLTEFIQKYPDRLGFSYSIANTPKDVDLCNTFHHLFDFVMREGFMYESDCMHCRGDDGSYYFYLDQEVQRIFKDTTS